MVEHTIIEDENKKAHDLYYKLHMISDKHYPQEVVIRTEYGDCTQILKIRFDEHQEVNNDH